MNSAPAISSTAPFKKCTMCGYEWATIEQVVTDGSLRVNGYQAVLGAPVDGLFFLTHECPHCHSTFAIPVRDFDHWNVGTRTTHLNAGSESCPGHCQNRNDLEPCCAECCMRWVRDVLQYLKCHQVPGTFV